VRTPVLTSSVSSSHQVDTIISLCLHIGAGRPEESLSKYGRVMAFVCIFHVRPAQSDDKVGATQGIHGLAGSNFLAMRDGLGSEGRWRLYSILWQGNPSDVV
jgi:hypothetical protein